MKKLDCLLGQIFGSLKTLLHSPTRMLLGAYVALGLWSMLH